MPAGKCSCIPGIPYVLVGQKCGQVNDLTDRDVGNAGTDWIKYLPINTRIPYIHVHQSNFRRGES